MNAREKWREVRATDTPVKLTFGPNLVDRFLGDPKRVAFFLGRYAFAAKMLTDCETILDVGCGAGEGTLTFLQDTNAQDILGIDFDETLIAYANQELLAALVQSRPQDVERIEFLHADFLEHSGSGFAGLACLDVIEHVDPEQSDKFIARLAQSLHPNGIAVIGTPNGYAAHLGSAHSQLGHINNLTPEGFRESLKKHFSNIFLFGMNDATLHTGHPSLWHYILAIGVR